MFDSLLLFAAPKGAPPGGGFDQQYFMFLILGLFGLFFFLVILPGQRKRAREQQEMGSKAEKGDKVVTIGGIYGTVVSVNEKEDEVVVQVADNTRLKFRISAIHQNATLAERRKAEADKAKKS